MSSNPQPHCSKQKAPSTNGTAARVQPDQCSSSSPPPVNEGIVSPILESLECIICLEASVSPIYACIGNGHLTCGSCYDSYTELQGQRRSIKCSLCKSPLAVNTFAERLSRKWDIKAECSHTDAGCKDIFPAASVRDHIKECEFRPINCYYRLRRHRHSPDPEVSRSRCRREIPMQLYADHRNKIHNSPIYSGDTCSLCFSPKHLFTQGNPVSHPYWTGVKRFIPAMMQYDGRKFQVNVEVRNKAINWRILLLGSEKEALKYLCKTQLLPTLNGPENTTALLRSAVVQTIPVLGYHRNLEFDEFCPDYASATAAQVTAACKEVERTTGETRFEFRLHFEFLKNESQMDGVSSARKHILGKRKLFSSAVDDSD